MASEPSEAPPYPIYSTTFAVHRVSPLYHSDNILDNGTLRYYASQFRDLLAGDVLRGVRVGLAGEDEVLARIGGLRDVKWQLLGNENEWLAAADQTQLTDDRTMNIENSERGMFMEVTYEKGAYSAILLKGPIKGQPETEGFSNYPLLLTRMPNSLRNTFLEFLSTTFDTRVSVLKLPTKFLTSSLEKFLEGITTWRGTVMETVPAIESLRSITKDVFLTLVITNPEDSASLKSIDITIPKDDVWRMMIRGKKISEIKPDVPRGQPFITALAYYIDGHLALNINHPDVNITKIACGAFVMGSEGKLKLFPPPSGEDQDDVQTTATNALVAALIELAGNNALAGFSTT
jgi:hypothetical protein